MNRMTTLIFAAALPTFIYAGATSADTAAVLLDDDGALLCRLPDGVSFRGSWTDGLMPNGRIDGIAEVGADMAFDLRACDGGDGVFALGDIDLAMAVSAPNPAAFGSTVDKLVAITGIVWGCAVSIADAMDDGDENNHASLVAVGGGATFGLSIEVVRAWIQGASMAARSTAWSPLRGAVGSYGGMLCGHLLELDGSD